MATVDFWTSFCEINRKNIIFNKLSRKKKVFSFEQDAESFFALGSTTNEEVFGGFEADLRACNYLILDIDCLDKKSQKEFIPFVDLHNLAKKYNLYIEKSINTGLHILFHVDNEFCVMREKCPLGENIIFEFKRMCLVAPTPGYECLFKPNIQVPLKLTHIVDIVSEIARVLLDDGGEQDELEKGGSVSSKYYSDFFDSLKYKEGAIKRKNVEALLPASKNALPRKKKRANTNECIDMSMEDEEKKQDRTSNKKQPTVLEQTNQITSEFLLVKNLASLEVDSHLIHDEVDGMEATSSDGQMDLMQVDSKTTPEEAAKKRKIMRLFQDILDNICDKLTGVVCKTIIFGFHASLTKLVANLNKKALNEKTQMFGENVKIFLEYMMRVDDPAHSRVQDSSLLAASSLYSSLEEGVKWRKWTRAYCLLILTLESIGHKNGFNSRLHSFDDYALYRKVTRLNSVGVAMSELEAQQEYDVFKTETKHWFGSSYYNCIDLFLEFIMITLGVVKINARVLQFFAIYVDYSTDTRQEIDFYYELLLFVKLKNFDVRFNYVQEEGDRNVLENVAVVNFNKYHWIKVNNEIFKCLLSKCFPNLTRVDNLVRHISNQDCSKAQIYNKKEFKQWKNIVPFTNGVFDFAWHKQTQTNTNDNALIKDRLGKNPILEMKTRHDVAVSEYDLNTFKNFSIFRNYTHEDSVMSPIGKSFDIHEYLLDFEQTCLLSLENITRYSEEFCAYMRCLFGNSANEGLMGPFQYVRLLITIILVALGLIRNKTPQTTLNLIGCGSNGKSQFLNILYRFLGDKMAYILSRSFFNDNELNQQGVGIDEACFVFDTEAEEVFLHVFRAFVGDEIAPPRRRLFKSLERDKKNLATVLLCSNAPLRYITSNRNINSTYDLAFDRRVMVMPFYNIVGRPVSGASRVERAYKEYCRSLNTSGECYRPPNKKQRILEDEIQADSLFRQLNFDFKNEEVNKKIQCGLVYYLLDTIHVFDLANLNSSFHEHIVSSYANKRLLGKANYPFLQLLLDKYFCFD
jgi:hypothetical protein